MLFRYYNIKLHIIFIRSDIKSNIFYLLINLFFIVFKKLFFYACYIINTTLFLKFNIYFSYKFK